MEMLSFSFLILVSIFSTLGASEPTIRPESRIIGGEFASEGEFPHQVVMLIPEESFYKICGGSILDSIHILIAAHCVSKTDSKEIIIAAGLTDISRKTKKDEVGVDKVIIHPCYDQEMSNVDDNMLFNDIAIVKLAQNLPLDGQTIEKIQIDEQNLATDGTVTKSIGWGRTNSTSPDAGSSDVLKKASLTVITTECKDSYFSDLVSESQICAENKAEFICSGDSGGPLLCDDGNGRNVLCGIVSLAGSHVPDKPCLGPSVFTRVYHYRHWINDVLNGKESSESGCVGSRVVTSSPSGSPVPRFQIFAYGICLFIIFFSSLGTKFTN